MGGSVLALTAGLALLIAGAEALVRGGAGTSRRLGIPPLLIGLTVVAFGTSAPELIVSVQASMAGRGDIAVGNVVGSNIANIALILGLSGLVRPLVVRAKLVAVDIPIMIAASLLAVLLLRDAHLGRGEGLLMAAGLAGFVWLTVELARRERNTAVSQEFEAGVPPVSKALWVDIVLLAAGVAMLAYGADTFLSGAVDLAVRMGAPEALVGLTLVAVGTSLPELVTSVVAAFRREADISVGNVVGSNIFNILGVLGVSSLVKPLQADGILLGDMAVMTAAAVAVLPLARSGLRLNRWESALLLAGYAGYLLFRAQA